MYSIVLLAAITSGDCTISCHRGGGCYGCYGCYGYGCCGYYDYCCYPCYDYCCYSYSYGCCGYYGGYGGYNGYGPGGSFGTPPATQPPPATDGKKEISSQGPAPATIVVSLPRDARLLFDDSPTRSTGMRRVFVSPKLKRGLEYSYTLKAEAMRNGQRVSVEREVKVLAGETTPVTLSFTDTKLARR